MFTRSARPILCGWLHETNQMDQTARACLRRADQGSTVLPSLGFPQPAKNASQYSRVQSPSATGILNGLLRRLATPRGFEWEKQHVIVSMIMEPASLSLNEPQQSKPWWRATDVPPSIGVYPGRFSPMVTLLSALFLTVALGSVVGLSVSTSKLDRIESPEQALSLMVSRTMDVQEGLKRAPYWEQQLFAWTSSGNEAEWAHEIEWYQELAEISEDPLVPLQLAVLQAEAGHVSQALLSANEWARAEDPLAKDPFMTRRSMSCGKQRWQRRCPPAGFTIAWLNASQAVPTMLPFWPGFRNRPLCVSTASLSGRIA